MLNRHFCGNGECVNCTRSYNCILDATIPCSPDCENLTPNGKILVSNCIKCKCDAVFGVFGIDDRDKILERYGDMTEYPCHLEYGFYKRKSEGL